MKKIAILIILSLVINSSFCQGLILYDSLEFDTNGLCKKWISIKPLYLEESIDISDMVRNTVLFQPIHSLAFSYYDNNYSIDISQHLQDTIVEIYKKIDKIYVTFFKDLHTWYEPNLPYAIICDIHLCDNTDSP